MEPEDLAPVLAIERVAFPNPWSEELFRRELSHGWSTILLAEQPREDEERLLAGFLIYWLVHDEIHILNVATDPTRRRRGAARTLLADCLKRGVESGARLATLEVRRSNRAAIDLYASFGFRSVGVRSNYYPDEGEDAIVMTLDL